MDGPKEPVVFQFNGFPSNTGIPASSLIHHSHHPTKPPVFTTHSTVHPTHIGHSTIKPPLEPLEPVEPKAVFHPFNHRPLVTRLPKLNQYRPVKVTKERPLHSIFDDRPVGMVSNKMSKATIFVHKHFKKKIRL